MGQRRKPAQEDSLFGDAPLAEAPKLGVVRARFEGEGRMSFEDILSGCDSLRVLTYSNSLSVIRRAASLVEDVEIIFGREDIVGEAEKLYFYQSELVKAVRDEISPDGSKDESDESLTRRVADGGLRLFVVKDLVSHEKLFLMEGEGGRRILTGSANLSERALGGRQNEGYVLFEDSAAWEYYERRYERIKASSALAVPKRALLSEDLDPEDLPVFSKETTGSIIAVEDGSPENGIVRKVVSSKTPPHFAGLSAVVPKNRGAATFDAAARTAAIRYMKSNLRTEKSNPEEYMSVNVPEGAVELSGKRLDLSVSAEEVARDVRLWVRYFDGFSLFKGENEKLARDYFSFWGWLWFGAFLCDARNAAQASDDDVNEFPVFGILYGQSNCGKSELVDTLLRSMFGKSGATPTEWFTKNRVGNLMEENRRYPLVFDDLERKRYSDHAVSLIKVDDIRLPEYPPVVLSMNATTQDTFETEVRKRCFVIHTGASLQDDDPESRRLGKTVKEIKRDLGTAMYREYLRRAMKVMREGGFEGDLLALSSGIIADLIREHHDGDMPAWCVPTDMGEHRRGRHDKVREDLRQLRIFDSDSWERRGNRWTLRMGDHNAANRLRRDVPDYLLSAGNASNLVVFDAEGIEAFVGREHFEGKRPLFSFLRRG